MPTRKAMRWSSAIAAVRRRDEQADRSPRHAGTNEEGGVLLGIARRELDGVDTALQLVGNGERERRLPIAIDQRVGMQLNAAVFSGRQPKAVVAAGPVPAGQPTDGAIVTLGVQLVRAGVDQAIANPLLAIASGRVPIGKHAGGIRPGTGADRIERAAIERQALHAAPIDLAAIALAEECAARLAALGRRADDEAAFHRYCGPNAQRLILQPVL